MDDLSLLKHRLLERLEEAILPLNFSEKETQVIVDAHEISFEAHRLAPNRASGEIYYMHVFRQTLRMIKRMRKHKVSSANLLAAILLHDAVEDATKGKTTPFIVKSQIENLINDFVVYLVLSLTKKKSLESRPAFFRRIISNETWEVLVAKPEDINDNILTLAAMPFHKQHQKIKEVFDYSDEMKKRAIKLITNQGKNGILENYVGWINLVKELNKELKNNARHQQKRLRKMGVEVV